MKRIIFVLLTLLSFTINTDAGNHVKQFEIPVWGNKKVATGGSYEPTMVCYLPEKPNGLTVIECPGGAYNHLAVTYEGYDMAPFFNALGVTYIVLKYRLPQNHVNYPLIDAREAVRVVRRNAGKWKIDPHKVGIMGCSAGGHVASMLATDDEGEGTRPDFQILFYPVITMRSQMTDNGTKDRIIGMNAGTDLVTRYSTDERVDEKTPQAFIVLSSNDSIVRPVNSIRYFEALRKFKVPVSMHMYTTGGHGFGYSDGNRYKPMWTEELAFWLRNGLIWKNEKQ